jgi:hypothetical protein
MCKDSYNFIKMNPNGLFSKWENLLYFQTSF